MSVGLKANVDGTSGTVQVNGTDVVTVNSSGNVGIGVTPSWKLQVAGDTVLGYTANTSNLLFRNLGGRNRIDSYNDPITANYPLQILGSPLVFVTNDTERMYITSAGNVGIGHPNGEGYRLLVQGSGTTSSTYPLVVRNANSTALFFMEDSGRIFAPPTYSTTITSSVRDLQIDSGGMIGYVASVRAAKTNIAALTDVSWLNQLNPCTFNFRKRDADGNYTDEVEPSLEYGLIAEEVEQVNPELVFYDQTENGPELRGVSYSKLIVPLLAALQKANAKIDALEARLAALEAK